MKKVFKIMFFTTLALILLFVALVVVSVFSVENHHADSIGIIGGADGPTAIFITNTLIFNNPIWRWLRLVLLLFIASSIGWFITRNK